MLLLLTSCGDYLLDEGVRIIDGETNFIIDDSNRCTECMFMQDQFKSELAINSIDVPIGFAEFEDSKAGICYLYKNGEPAYIKINREIWDTLTKAVKLTLIYHELGHCHLGLDHIEDYDVIDDTEYVSSSLIKLSIMHPSIMSPFQAAYTKYHWEDYIAALKANEAIQDPEEIDLKNLSNLHYADIKEFNIKVESQDDEENIHINKNLYFPRICSSEIDIFRSHFNFERESDCTVELD